MANEHPCIRVRDLTMAYGDRLIQRDLNFTVGRGDVFIVMGGSGCGKSTLMRHLIGLHKPARGDLFYEQTNFWECGEAERTALIRRIGVTYQSGALWSSMTLSENVALPLQEFTDLSPKQIRAVVDFKLALVGLDGFQDHYPGQISGGMQKRAGLARALALDPEVLFFDEPSAGLDPLSARRLDELIVTLSSSMGSTVVVVTHDLESIFAIGTDAVFLDADTKTIIARGNPRRLRDASEHETVRRFLTRGNEPDGLHPKPRSEHHDWPQR